MIVLHNTDGGNNRVAAVIIAGHFGCERATAGDAPALDGHDSVIFVVPNTGDEELPQPMEDYLCGLSCTGKRYMVCELGNYFGFEDYVGCKKIVCRMLDSLGWVRVADVSLDSLPALDEVGLREWLNGSACRDFAQPS